MADVPELEAGVRDNEMDAVDCSQFSGISDLLLFVFVAVEINEVEYKVPIIRIEPECLL